MFEEKPIIVYLMRNGIKPFVLKPSGENVGMPSPMVGLFRQITLAGDPVLTVMFRSGRSIGRAPKTEHTATLAYHCTVSKYLLKVDLQRVDKMGLKQSQCISWLGKEHFLVNGFD